MRLRSKARVTHHFPTAGRCQACGYAAAHVALLEDGTRRVLHVLARIFPCDIPPDPTVPKGQPS